jgi:hypothetical protein
MLPTDGSGLPAWRQKVMPWIMGLVRLGAGWLVANAPLAELLDKGSYLRVLAGLPLRTSIAALYVVGLALFAWPATCFYGYGLLLVAVGAFEWLWARTGITSGLLPVRFAAVLTVLACGEWLTRRVQRRLYPR